jgi:hypothetical protein
VRIFWSLSVTDTKYHHKFSNAITYEVHTDGRNVTFCVGVISESQEKTRFADTGVSDKEELKQVIVSEQEVNKVSYLGAKVAANVVLKFDSCRELEKID